MTDIPANVVIDDDPLDIRPTSDIFISVFLSKPENEHILCHLINAVLKNSGQSLIVEATVLNPFVAKNYAPEKQITLDVHCRDETGRTFCIEIQTHPHAGFKERILFGVAKTYGSQELRGREYRGLKPVYSITICEFSIFSSSKKLHMEFVHMEKDEHIVFSRHLPIHLLRLFPVKMGDLSLLSSVCSELSYWVCFLLFGRKGAEVMSSVYEHPIVRAAFSDPIIVEACRQFRSYTKDEEARDMERRHEAFLLRQGLMVGGAWEGGMEKGIEIGREEGIGIGREEGIGIGREEGRQEEKFSIARNLLAGDMSLENVVLFTGLSMAEVEKLSKE